MYMQPTHVLAQHISTGIGLFWDDFSHTQNPRETWGQDYKRFSSMDWCSTHNLCSEMT